MWGENDNYGGHPGGSSAQSGDGKRARAPLQKRPEIAGARQQENGMERGAVTKKGPEHGAAMVKRVGAR